MPESGYKRCPVCGETKLKSEFNRDRSQPYGIASRCRLCNREQIRAYRKANPKYAAEGSRSYRERNPEKVREINKRWAKENPKRRKEIAKRCEKRNPEKAKARRAVANAVNRGKLIKPDACEDCGRQCEARNLHGHHEDYSKKLDVEWLCQLCHSVRHGAATT